MSENCVPCDHLRQECPPNRAFEGLFPYTDQGKFDFKMIFDTYNIDFLIQIFCKKNNEGKHDFIKDLLV